MTPTATLEATASQTVHIARAFETAVHAKGPWELTLGNATVKALRLLGDDSVAFYATFSQKALAEATTDTLTLTCNGQPILSRPFTDTTTNGCNVAWVIGAPEPALV